MYTDDHIQTDSASRHLALLQEYRDTVERLFPALTRRTLDNLSISSADALFVGLFMDHYPRRPVVFESGVKLGTSTFLLANHPKVSRVVGIDRNPHVAEDAPDGGRTDDDTGTPEGLGMLDVARAALAAHAVAWQKIELHNSAESSMEEIAAESSADDEGLIFLINAPQGREEVSDELKTIFDQHPQALVFLGHCRGALGPFVQAGVVDCMGEMQDGYHFRLASDLGLGLAGSSLGVVHPDSAMKEMDEVLGETGRQFSERLDPLRLLQREEELIESTNGIDRGSGQDQRSNSELKKQNDELGKQVSSLTRQIEHLNHHYSSRRYKLADAAMDRLQRLRSLKRLVGRGDR